MFDDTLDTDDFDFDGEDYDDDPAHSRCYDNDRDPMFNRYDECEEALYPELPTDNDDF